MSLSKETANGNGSQTANYKGFVAGIFSGIAKLTGIVSDL
jgi:hypothetical protein